jgi:hypothetical protein
VAWVVLVSALAVGAGIYLWADGITVYRGISGVDYALLAYVLITMAAQDGGPRACLWVIALALATLKATAEVVTGSVFFPTSAPATVEVVVVTHAVGLGAGTALALTARCASQVSPLWRRLTQQPSLERAQT